MFPRLFNFWNKNNDYSSNKCVFRKKVCYSTLRIVGDAVL